MTNLRAVVLITAALAAGATGCGGSSSKPAPHRAASSHRPAAAGSSTYATSGKVPAPYDQVVGGYLCDTDKATLSRTGHLQVLDVHPVVEWSVEFDDRRGQPLSDASGMVGVGDLPSIDVVSHKHPAFAQVTGVGSGTNLQCVVIAQ